MKSEMKLAKKLADNILKSSEAKQLRAAFVQNAVITDTTIQIGGLLAEKQGAEPLMAEIGESFWNVELPLGGFRQVTAKPERVTQILADIATLKAMNFRP